MLSKRTGAVLVVFTIIDQCYYRNILGKVRFMKIAFSVDLTVKLTRSEE